MITSIILTQPVDSFSCFTHPRFALWFVILTHNCQILIKHDQWSSTTTQPVDSFSCFNHPWFGPSDNQHIAIHSWTHLVMMMIILWWLWLWLCQDLIIDWFDESHQIKDISPLPIDVLIWIWQYNIMTTWRYNMKVTKSRMSVLCLLAILNFSTLFKFNCSAVSWDFFLT